MFGYYGEEAECWRQASLAAAENSGASVEAINANNRESRSYFSSGGLRDIQEMTTIQAAGLRSKLMPVCISAMNSPADPVKTGRAVPQQQRHQSFATEQQMSWWSLPLLQ